MKSLCDIFTKKCGVAKKLALRFSILALPERERERIFFFATAAAELKIRGGMKEESN